MNQPPLPTDKTLVHQALAGDQDAFNHLVQRHINRIYSLALRMTRQREDAEEVVQQTFLSLVEHLNQYREEAAFSTWLMRIATNKALNLLRKRKKQSHSSGWEPEELGQESWESIAQETDIVSWPENPELLVQKQELHSILHESLQRLAPKYHLVFVLRDIQGFSTAETAEFLGLSQANVKIRLMRARLALRKEISEKILK